MSTKNKGYLVPENINPTEEIGFCVPVPNDPAYIRAFLGQLNELSRWGMWEKENSHKAVQAAARWFDSYQRISDCTPCDCDDCLGDCGVIFYPDDPRIEYAPNDPFRTPDHEPIGYPAPPWYLDEGRPATNLFHFPAEWAGIGAIISGFPRFTVHFKGEGLVQFYLRRVPQGGLVYITLDGNPLGTIVNMASWQVFDYDTWLSLIGSLIGGSLTGSLWSLDIVEIAVEGGGDHSISLTCLPNVNPDVLLGFGAQLEKIRICTDEEQEEIEEMPPQFQVVDCVLSWRPNSDADWVELVDLRTCTPDLADGIATPEVIDWYCRSALVFATELIRQATEQIEDAKTEGDVIGIDSSKFEYMLPLSVRDDDIFPQANGTWAVVIPSGYDNWDDLLADEDASEYLLIHLREILECKFKNEDHAALDYEYAPVDPDETLAQGLFDSGSYDLLELDPVTFDVIGSPRAEFLAQVLFWWWRPYAFNHFDDFINAINYEANLSETFGVVPCLVEECEDDDDDTWTHTFDFLVEDGEFIPVEDSGFIWGEWEVGEGWKSKNYMSPSETPLSLMSIVREFDERIITRAYLEYSVGEWSGGAVRFWAINATHWELSTLAGSFEEDHTGLMVASDTIQIALTSNNHTVNFAFKVTLEGLGTNPFL